MKRYLPLLLLPLALLVVPAPAQAAPCSGTSGVTVVVQYPDKHIEVGCAHGDPTSGLDALDRAGFHYRFVPRQQGAVCTIDGQPSSGQCFKAPDYWAYFNAQPGGAWHYSDAGAGATDPAPGSVEGWRFGGSPGHGPTIRPPGGVTPPKPTKKPTHHATQAPTSATPTPTTSTSATPSKKPRPHPTKAAQPPVVTATGTPTPTYQEPGAGEKKSSSGSSGGGASWIWGVVLVGLVGGVGGAVALRRRQG